MPDDAPIIITAATRLRHATTVEQTKECMRGIIQDGITFARDNDISSEDPTGCYEQFFECLRKTFELSGTRDERRLARYTFMILFEDPANRDTLIGLMADHWLIREIISQNGDEDGSAADTLCKIRMRVRSIVETVIESIDETDRMRRISGEVVSESSEDEDNDDSGDDTGDDVANSMQHAQIM